MLETIEMSWGFWFGVISLIFSALTLYQQRKRLTVSQETFYYPLIPQQDILLNENPYPTTYKKAIYTCVKMVNPGHINMGFFDLRAFNPKTNENHVILTRNTCVKEGKETYLHILPFGSIEAPSFHATLPEGNYGAVPAGTFLCLDIIIFINEYVSLEDGIMLSFKTTEWSLFHRSKYSDTNRKCFRAYERLIDVSNYEKLLLNRDIKP